MKRIINGFVILAAATFTADARLIHSRPFRELEKKADIIVVAKPVSTQVTAEQLDLAGISPPVHAIGLSSKFEVSVVLKGNSGLKELIVHHYRPAKPIQPMDMGTALAFASFDPTESKRYMLFLQSEPDGRFAPFDQIDPAGTSILALSGTGWDEMKSEDFKNWLDAKKWLREMPRPGLTMSPKIPPGGTGVGSLHEAALNGKLEKARSLLKAKPDLVSSHASYAGVTPLHLAAESGHKDLAELLLEYKADVEAKAYGGWTPLLNAVFGGHKSLVELLMANKADVNVKEDAGRTPLHVAAENGYTEIAAFLLSSKADVNARNRDGDTPLHIAAGNGPKAIVELLLANKAEINIRDTHGRTPLGLAVLHTNNDVAELLRQHGGRD